MKFGNMKLGTLLIAASVCLAVVAGCSTYGNRTIAGEPEDRGHDGDHGRPGPEDHGRPDDRRDEHSAIRVHDAFRGHRPDNWRHMDHVAFTGHEFIFDWNHIHAVTCVAADNYNDHYPFTEDSYRRDQWQTNMGTIEETALDYCFNTSPIGNTCRILTCTSL